MRAKPADVGTYSIARSWARWQRSRSVGAQQQVLDRCPCCHGSRFELLFRGNDLSTRLWVDRRLARGDYSLCHGCGTVFAASRPKPEATDAYYALFPELEDKTHGVYPPPNRRSTGKKKAAQEIIKILDSRGLLEPEMSLLHIRCDAGTLRRRPYSLLQ